MIVAADNAMLGCVELPGRGKRALSPPPAPPSYKKHLKTSCSNPLLSGNTRPDTEDTWSISILKASDNDSRPEEEKEFGFPPALEAFAEKIGIGLSEEWSDLKAPSPTAPSPAPSPAPWLQDDPEPQTVEEEEVWWEEAEQQSLVLVSPTELEGRQLTVTQEEAVTTNTTTTTISQNEKRPRFTEADNNELDTFWSQGLESSILNKTDTMADDEGQTFDIVEFALGESGVDLEEDADLTEDDPTETTMDIDEDDVPDLKKINAEPTELVEMKPVENVSIEVIEETPRKSKRKAGRPINHDPITVTVIPRASKLSEAELKALKYRRTRDLNNKASRRFRLKKKEKEEMELQELVELEARNNQLQLTAESMEEDVALWRARVSNIKH